jgi:hypothetical protein
MKTKVMTRVVAMGLCMFCGLSLWAGEPAFTKTAPFAGADHPREAGGNVWGDYNNDGKPDVFMFGYGTFKLYQGGADDTTFTDVTDAVFGASHPSTLWCGSAAWLDYNKDGNLDLIIAGNDGSADVTTIYANGGSTGSYALTASSITLPAMQSGDGSATGRFIAVADYDGDSYPDVLMSGKSADASTFALYKNNAGAGFVLQSAALNGGSFTQVSKGSVAWGDFNKDGKPDILFNGNTVSPDQRYTGIYKNNGDGTFDFIQLKDSQDRNITVEKGEVAWIDYDKDSCPDVLITGQGEWDGGFSWWTVYLFHNNGDGTFTQAANHGIGQTCESSVAVGDINKDGYDDVVVIGQYDYGVYYNNGDGAFTKSKILTYGQITKGMVSLVDLGSDDDLDIITTGNYIEPVLYQNNHPVSSRVDYPAFEKTAPFAGAGSPRSCGGIAYADYDKDGKLDVFIYGYGAAKLYKGDGSGAFTDATPAGFPGMLWQGSAAWIDYNNDGYPDLIMTGSNDGTLLTRVYKNTGGVLALDESIALPPMKGQGETTPSNFLAVADYDDDGYEDFVVAAKVAGSEGEATVFQLYKSTGSGFTLQTTAYNGGEFPNHFDRSSLAWGDFNSDGKPDILFNGHLDDRGSNPSDGVAGVYKNNGDGTFTLIPLPKGTYEGEVAWLDYDKDGKQDILLTGYYWEGDYHWWNAFLFHNNGDETFTEVAEHGIGGACKSAIAVGDLNGDSYDDVVIIGEATDAVFYNNAGSGAFTQKLAALGLYTTNSDATYITGTVQVTRGDAVIRDVDGDGNLDITVVGDNVDASLYLNKNPAESGEELTTQPPFQGTPFTVVPTPVGGTAEFPLNLQKGSGVAWGDYNNDGNLDVLIWGYYDSESAPLTKFYENSGNGTFTDRTSSVLGSSFPKIAKGAAAWFDYNNDGRLDLFIFGATKVDDAAENQTTVTKMYMNTGPSVSYQLNEVDVSGIFSPFDTEKSGGTARNIAVADYNNDGWQDILICARYTDVDAGGTERRLELYKNVGNADGRTFALQENTGLTAATNGGGIAWGDYNNDGWQDILYAGYQDGDQAWVSGVYTNNGDGTFTETKFTYADDAHFGFETGEVSWVDYDSDGDLDALLTGTYSNSDGWQWWNAFIYPNNGDGTFGAAITQDESGLRGTCESSVTWADLDGNGYVDILIIGQGNSICYNNGDGTFTRDDATLGADFRQGTISLVDYNKDGKLDIFATGQSGALLLRNDGEETPAAPAVPAGFTATPGANGELTLAWTASSDPTVRYNIFAKQQLSQTRISIISLALVDEATGALKVSYDHLPLLSTNTCALKGIDGGAYTVGVQAVGVNGKTSAFATTTVTVAGGSSTGVENAIPGAFSAYRSGEAIVAATDVAQEAELAVYTVSGAKVWSKIGVLAGVTQITGLPQGAVYFVALRVGGKVEVHKVAL